MRRTLSQWGHFACTTCGMEAPSWQRAESSGDVSTSFYDTKFHTGSANHEITKREIPKKKCDRSLTMVHLSPSILAANFSKLGEQVAEAEAAGVERLHVDVMDGHFVPNLSMGPVVVEGLRPMTKLFMEVHLMVEAPARFVEPFIKKGADLIIVHHEVLLDARPVLESIHRLGKKAGLAINPDAPVEAFVPY